MERTLEMIGVAGGAGGGADGTLLQAS